MTVRSVTGILSHSPQRKESFAEVHAYVILRFDPKSRVALRLRMDHELQSAEACESQQGTSMELLVCIEQFILHVQVMLLLHEALFLYIGMPSYGRTFIQIWWISGLSRFTAPIKVDQLDIPMLPYNDVGPPKIPKDKVFLVQFFDRFHDTIEKILGWLLVVKSIPR